MSISEALNYPFRNNNLLKVLPVALTYGIALFILNYGTLTSSIPFMLLGLVGLLAIAMFIGGYYVSALRRLQDNDENLPEYVIGQNIKDGFLIGIAGIVYMLPAVIVFFLAGGMTFINAGATPSGGATLFVCGGLIVAFILTMLLGAAAQVGVIRYAAEEQGGLFDIGGNWQLVTGNFGLIAGFWGRTFVIGILTGIISFVLGLILAFMFPDQNAPFFQPTFSYWMVYALVNVAAYTISMIVGLAQYHLMWHLGRELGIADKSKVKRDAYEF